MWDFIKVVDLFFLGEIQFRISCSVLKMDLVLFGLKKGKESFFRIFSLNWKKKKFNQQENKLYEGSKSFHVTHSSEMQFTSLGGYFNLHFLGLFVMKWFNSIYNGRWRKNFLFKPRLESKRKARALKPGRGAFISAMSRYFTSPVN